MTRTTNARIAGVTSFVYLAAGIGTLLLGRGRASNVLVLFEAMSALVLGVTLYAITREEDADLAMLALVCRVIEAVPGPGEFFFAVGNTLFCWLLLRGRLIPAGLARLGVLASALLVAILLLERAEAFGGPTSWSSSATWVTRLPVLVFELTLAVWFITKGVGASSRLSTQL